MLRSLTRIPMAFVPGPRAALPIDVRPLVLRKH